jgi:thiol-disulfide isomerase/thioredoxin
MRVRLAARGRRVTAWFLLALPVVCVGCGRGGGPQSAVEDEGAGAENPLRDDEAASMKPSMPDEQRASVEDQIQSALAAAKNDGNRVLLEFGADWCPDCRALDRMFAQQPVLATLQSAYHVVQIDVGRRDRHLDIVARYDNPIAGGIPAVVILDEAGKVLATTKQGELATARSMDSSQVLGFLRRWAPQGQVRGPEG